MKRVMNAILAGMCLLGVAGTAQAVTLDLTVDGCAQGCGPAGTVFATVTLTDTAAGVDFTIRPGPGFYLTSGDGYYGTYRPAFSFATNVPVMPYQIVNVWQGGAFVDWQKWAADSDLVNAGHRDGGIFGNFTVGMIGADYNGPVSFTVLGLDLDNLIQSSGGDYNTFFAVGVLGKDNNHYDLVGFAGQSLSETPLPGAVWLFASGFAGLCVLGRRKRNNSKQEQAKWQ
jgi:hypothetical protein